LRERLLREVLHKERITDSSSDHPTDHLPQPLQVLHKR